MGSASAEERTEIEGKTQKQPLGRSNLHQRPASSMIIRLIPPILSVKTLTNYCRIIS
jgi:hypothetical protein